MKRKNNIKNLFLLIITILIVSQCQLHVDKNKILSNKHNKKNNYSKQYKKFTSKNQIHHEFFVKKNFNNNLIIQPAITNQIIPDYLFSEIHIDYHSLNLLNTYSINNKQLIFNQLNLQFLNKKTTYNFGIGYRKFFYKNWIIGNNIFYDTTMSTHKKNIVSIGYEILNTPIYITANTYHNMFNDNFYSTIPYKKYCPSAYDVRIKIPLPFSKIIIWKMNLEYYLKQNKNHKNTLLDNIHTTNNYYTHKNIYKLTFGINYTPISILTLNIDKIIYNSLQNHEMIFNITANYNFNILNIINTSYNNKKITNSNTDIFLTENNHTVNRNNTILSNHTNNDLNKIKKINIIQNYSDGTKLLKNIFSNNIHTNSPITDNIKNQHTHYENILIVVKKPLNLKKTTTKLYQTDSFSSINISSSQEIKSNNLSSDDNKDNETLRINKIVDDSNSDLTKKNNNNSNRPFIPHNPKIYSKKNENNQITHSKSNYDNNIPTPPPLPTFSIPAHTNSTKQPTHLIDTNSDSSNDSQNHLISKIKNINQNKQKKFHSLGSEKHLIKLNNITKKRKKTTSTSSTNSNNSEISTVLKIIERQKISITDSDETNHDEKHSMSSNNEFSDN